MASNLAPGSSPADLIPHQGMSPTQTLDGEQHGPDYARMVPQQLREEEQRLQASLMVPNGVPPRAEVLGPSEGTSDDQRRDQPGARRHEGDREVRFMTGGSENVMMRDFPQGGTGPAASVHESTASGRDGTLYDDAGAALFDRFQPSPLPGQSPAAAGQIGNSRAPTWFTRLGDYIQRRVEVTSWASPPHASHPPLGPRWSRAESATMVTASSQPPSGTPEDRRGNDGGTAPTQTTGSSRTADESDATKGS